MHSSTCQALPVFDIAVLSDCAQAPQARAMAGALCLALKDKARVSLSLEHPRASEPHWTHAVWLAHDASQAQGWRHARAVRAVLVPPVRCVAGSGPRGAQPAPRWQVQCEGASLSGLADWDASGALTLSQAARALAAHWLALRALRLPLNKHMRVLDGEQSFTTCDLSLESEIPVGSHPGAFGVTRRNHVHEGVDLYGLPGDPVRAMEAGVVVGVGPFTGPAAGSPWWLDTQCVLLEGASGVLNYGEIHARAGLAAGQRIARGELLGTLATVLRKDKGRPRTMLHLERYAPGTRAPIREWSLGTPQPVQLLDPTVLLREALAGVRS